MQKPSVNKKKMILSEINRVLKYRNLYDFHIKLLFKHL